MWGSHVIVPPKGRSLVVKMLHEAHPGIARMKRLARVYAWWPGIDTELEKCVKECKECQTQQKTPPVTPLHPWSCQRNHGRGFTLIMQDHSWGRCSS